jgi:YVTN family beta-propeller protein/cysteine-rich repeat protein
VEGSFSYHVLSRGDDKGSSVRCLGAGIAAVFLAVDVTPVLAGPLAYLLNLDDPSITVVDTTSLTETATIALPDMPSAIVAGASGARVYVSYHADTPAGGLAVIDVATHAVSTVSFGQVAAGLAVDAAEGRAFLADVAEVAVVDLAGLSLAATFSAGTAFPFDVAIEHTTGRLYVANFDGFVSVHDGTTFASIATIPTDFDLQTIALSRGAAVGAANSGIGITLFDTSTNAAIGEVPTGVTPSEMVVTDDGTTVWALAKETNLAFAIDVATLAATAIPVGNAPRGLALDARGTRLFVGNSVDRTLSVIDPLTKAVVTTVPLTHQPAWIAVAPSCGDGAVGPNEECDDGESNGTADSCCSATCTFEPAGAACANPSGRVCGFSACDGAAHCRYTIAPRSDCKAPTTAHAASLVLTSTDPDDQRITWSWRHGETTALTDFGDPTIPGGPTYELCLYDRTAGIPGLVLGDPLGAIPAIPGWKAVKAGFRFRAPAGSTNPKILKSLSLNAGPDGKASAAATGRGHFGFVLPLARSPSVTAQLVTTNGSCWTSEFQAARRNDATHFSATSE